MQAFERYGVSRILAEPTVTAVSGENAKLTVGGEIPVPDPPTCTLHGSAAISARSAPIFKPYGVTLRFSPVVLSEGRILLHLATEVTEIDTQTAATVYGTLVPGFLTRKNETTVEIPSGGSIASAGLLQTISRQVDQWSSGAPRSAGSRRAVPLARLPAAGDRAHDHRHALYRQIGQAE